MGIQTRYDTNDVAEQDRFSYWREAVCDSYVQLGCETENRSDFTGRIEISRHTVLSISRVAGLSHSVERRTSDIRAASEPFFLLSLQTAKSSRVSQFGNTAHLQVGDMALYSSTDPYTLELSDNFSQTVVQMPAARLIDRLPNAELLAARRIDGSKGIGKLVRDNILAFSEHLNSSNLTLQALVQDTLIDLIATGLATESACAVEMSSPELQILLRTRSFIRSNLGDPDLDRQRVAEEMGLSVRRLNDIFAKEDGSISRYIRTTRLNELATALIDPRFSAQSITEIAFRFGFSNMQNVSTAFRSHFGSSPRDYRAQSDHRQR